MAAQDRDHQPKRDAWVAQRLSKTIESGRADPTDEESPYEPKHRSQSRKENKTKNPLRITLPH